MSLPSVLIRKFSEQPSNWATGTPQVFPAEAAAKITLVQVNGVDILETDWQVKAYNEIEVLKTLVDGDTVNLVVEGGVLKHAPWPNADMSPVIGLEPDLEWFLKYEPFPSPEYDSRIWILAITEDVTTEKHPDYPTINTYKRTYAENKRPDADINLAIENAEEAANTTLTDYRNNEKLFMLAQGIQVRRSRGTQPNAAELAIEDQILAFDVNIWKNDATKKSKKDQVANGQEPDIDAGWERGNSGNVI